MQNANNSGPCAAAVSCDLRVVDPNAAEPQDLSIIGHISDLLKMNLRRWRIIQLYRQEERYAFFLILFLMV
jgi:hypothetical protein